MTVASPQGDDILRLRDENGDGVNGRSQRTAVVTNGDPSLVETVSRQMGMAA